MVTLDSLKERWVYIDGLYRENYAQVVAFQASDRVNDLVQRVAVQELGLGQAGIDRCLAFLQDPVTVFRFLRKAHFDEARVTELLQRTLRWRLSSSVDLVAPSSIDPLYSENPLFFLNSNIRDKFGRTAAVINMRHMVRPEDNSLDGVKEFMAFQLEVARRYLADLSHRDAEDKPRVQIVILLDLAGASFSNLEVEMLPFVVDLLKHHFPGMVGATYILNYGWAYAGMWQVAKRVLPKAALEKILFPGREELLRYFDKEHLLVEHGGSTKYYYRLSNNHILTKYGRASYFLRHHQHSTSPLRSATASPAVSRPLSRISSFESAQDAFYSMPGTPKTSSIRTPGGSQTDLAGMRNGHKRPSWLAMTAAPTQATTFSHSPSAQNHLLPPVDVHGARGNRYGPASAYTAVESGLDDNSEPSDNEAEAGDWDQESLVSNGSEEGLASSPLSMYDPHGDPSREASLSRLKHQLEEETRLPHAGSSRPGRLSGSISPYNVYNPYYGYPATRYLPSTGSSRIPGAAKLPSIRPYHSRRRKRDLVKTLSYLFTLRVLALHRKIRWRVTVFWKLIWEGLRRWGAVGRRKSPAVIAETEEDTPRKKKGVRWDAAVTPARTEKGVMSILNPVTLLRIFPRWIVLLAGVLFFRSRFFQIRARVLIVWIKRQAEAEWKRFRKRQAA